MLDPLITALLVAWITACAQVHGVSPEFARAVATVESRPAGGGYLEMRVGRLGKSKYYGPLGVNEDCFKDKENVRNPFLNVYWGVKALRGANKRRVLKRYNTSFNEAYYREVRRVERKLKEGS